MVGWANHKAHIDAGVEIIDGLSLTPGVTWMAPRNAWESDDEGARGRYQTQMPAVVLLDVNLLYQDLGYPEKATPEETEDIYVRRCVPRKARLDLIYRKHANVCYDAAILWPPSAGLILRFGISLENPKANPSGNCWVAANQTAFRPMPRAAGPTSMGSAIS